MSGRHPTLPVAELRASLEAERYAYNLGEKQGRVILVEVDPQGALLATRRSGFVNYSLQLIFQCPMTELDILYAMNDVDYHHWLIKGTGFGVKLTRVQREHRRLDVEELQRKIGSQIWRAMKGKVHVNLEVPDTLFLGLITTKRFYFGVYIASRNRREFSYRRSPRRPFFNPDTIHPKIARAMVNLSHSASGDLFLDPFCGTGGLLLEAASIGSIPIGVDNDHRILWGCRSNLNHFKTLFFGIHADTRTLPFRSQSVDAIATDPPYGRSSSTRKSDIATLLKTSLTQLADVIHTNKYVCFAIPLEFFDEGIIDSKEYAIIEEHSVYVHRSLTRHIVVLKRK
ncbi:MAG: RsmD family RNA methyltransferase [Promethearchaeota archaeon]